MDFLEKDLEQIIYEANNEQLLSLRLNGKRLRQLRIGNYGISDLVFVEKIYGNYLFFDKISLNYYERILDIGLEITVCELKKDKIGISAFLQAVNYCKGIKEYLLKRGFNNFYFKILLLGRNIDNSGSFIYLSDLFDNNLDDESSVFCNNSIRDISFFTYSYGFNGLKFLEHENYHLCNNGF